MGEQSARYAFARLIMFMKSYANLKIPLCLLSEPQLNISMINDSFEIPVTWKDAEISFQARFIPTGYITRIGVDIYGKELVLEPDEEGLYRAVLEADALGNYPEIDVSLIKEIAHVLNTVNGTN